MLTSLLLSFLAVIIPSSNTITPWADLEKHADEVMVTPYMADDSRNAPTVIVCPGGSYHWLDVKGEGIEVAEWLRDNGINAVLLQYRTAGLGSCIWHYRFLFRGRRHPDMICDVQRTIRYVRENADSLVTCQKHATFVGGELARDELEKGGFSAPVHADNAQFVVFCKGK